MPSCMAMKTRSTLFRFMCEYSSSIVVQWVCYAMLGNRVDCDVPVLRSGRLKG